MSYRSVIYISLFLYRQHKRLIIIPLYLFLTCAPAIGQDIFSDDTITIGAVRVTAAGSIRHIPFSTAGIDSAAVAFCKYSDLGSLLQTSAPFYLKQNGNHGLASVSMRGMSGNHTMVLWNGISITTSNTGMSDFAIIPVLSASSVLLTGGGADLEEISGTIGGKIELLSEPPAKTGTEVSLVNIAGSWNEYSSILAVKTGNEKVSANLSIWGNKTKNNFLFTNNDNPEGPAKERRTNAAASSAGILHDLFFMKAESELSLHLWYNISDRNLPGPVTTIQQNFGETQSDRSLRSVIRFKTTAGRLSLDVVSGFTGDVNHYNNEAADVSGDNKTAAFTFKTSLKFRMKDNLELGIHIGDEYQTARSLSYEDRKERNLLSSGIVAVYSPGKRLRLTLQARQIMKDALIVSPEFTGGGSYLLSGDGSSIIRANVSRNMKLPTLNDLFWNPGGSPGLDPEISSGAEIGYSFNNINTSGIHNSLDITLHSSGISDLIQWVPGTYGYWSAENIRDVKVRGIETRVKRSVPFGRGKVTAGADYSFTSSEVTSSHVLNDKSIGRQLIYTPLHHFSVNMSASYNILNGGVRLFADSRRFTTSDNSEWLPAACQLNADIGASLPVKHSLVQLNLSSDNILNTSWESVSNYPMPLRSYRIRLILTFSSINKTENP